MPKGIKKNRYVELRGEVTALVDGALEAVERLKVLRKKAQEFGMTKLEDELKELIELLGG